MNSNYTLFVQQIHQQYGPKEAELLLGAMQLAPRTAIRINPFKPAPVFSQEEQVAWSKYGRLLGQRPSFTLDPFFHAGAYYVQEASSMFLEFAFQCIEKPLREEGRALKVLDLCAAPGGKSTHLASLISADDLLISNEILKSRVQVLRDNLVKWGLLNTHVTNLEPAAFGKIQGFFDLIVIDAPCSGEGLFRRDPAAMEEWSPEAVDMCSLRQQRIVEDALPALREGGYLIYSTCTLNQKEDEAVVKHLQSMGLESVDLDVPADWNLEIPGKGMVRFPFHRTPGEGFFIAVLQKKESSGQRDGRKIAKLNYVGRAKIAVFADWLSNFESLSFTNYGSNYYAFPKQHEAWLEFLVDRKLLFQAGIQLGELDKRGELIPTHDLAMLAMRAESIQTIELNAEQALAYLQKQVFDAGNQKGWYLATWQGLGLGLMKLLGNRMNNYYPQHLRILHA